MQFRCIVIVTLNIADFPSIAPQTKLVQIRFYALFKDTYENGIVRLEKQDRTDNAISILYEINFMKTCSHHFYLPVQVGNM